MYLSVFFVSLAFPVDVLYNAITIEIIRPKAEPFQIVEDGHIVRISIAGFSHTLKGTGLVLSQGRERKGMEIERINENTVKFFLSYIDIEERGFTREEVWYNRDKSEELFWEMMDEVNDEAEFEVEGPLWIQVHAMNGGIEVTVTRAQMSEDGEPLESPFTMDDPKKLFQHGKMFDDDADGKNAKMSDMDDIAYEWLDNMFVFTDFEYLIPLSVKAADYHVKTSLYSFEDNYYLHVVYDVDTMDDSRKSDMFSVMSEFGDPSNMTIHRIEEYGDLIMDADVFSKIQHYFGN